MKHPVRIRTLWMFAVLAVLTAAGPAAPVFGQGVKIGYVNLQRLERESAVARRGADLLKQEFDPRNQQIQEFQKRIAAAQARLEKEKDRLPPQEVQARAREISDMMRQSDQMVLRAGEEFQQRRAELGGRMVEDAQVAIKAVAEAGKFDLILQEAAYARAGVDITDQVLKEMTKRGTAAR